MKREQREVEQFRWRPAFFLATKNRVPIANLECNLEQQEVMRQTAALIFMHLELMHARAGSAR